MIDYDSQGVKVCDPGLPLTAMQKLGAVFEGLINQTDGRHTTFYANAKATGRDSRHHCGYGHDWPGPSLSSVYANKR